MTALLSLTRTEARLLSREWAAMVFAFAFPPLTLMVVAGAFGTERDPAFDNRLPADFYITGYLGVPIAALALIGLPVMLAGYRESGVLRRFAAFGVSTRRVVLAQALVTAGLVAVAAGTVAAVAQPTYGIPAVKDPLGVAAVAGLGTVTLIVLGVALGLAVSSARGAQAIGMLTFFPMFLLSGGGPPPDVMGDGMRRVADVLPLTHVVAGIRDPWLGTGGVGGHLSVLGIWLAAGAVAIAARLRHHRSDI
jgi:ABC-2 type transport system permease protein